MPSRLVTSATGFDTICAILPVRVPRMYNVMIVSAALLVVSVLPGWSSSAAPLPKGYHAWQKSDRKVVTDKNSLFYGVHYLYADKHAIEGYRAGNKFPEGSRIVVEFFAIKGTSSMDGPMQMIVLMHKDKRYKDTGGWRFAGYTAKGEASGIDPLKNCFECHLKEAGTQDYVISTLNDFSR